MIERVEDSYINENESISIGNAILYKLCNDYPMNDDVNGMIAKLWLIGRSYAASPERRNYSKKYRQNDIDAKIDLSTGSNGRDTFFNKLSKKVISDCEYNKLKSLIDEIKAINYSYDYSSDKPLLEKTVIIVLLFNRILRRSIESIDEQALEKYENQTNKKKEDRGLRYFISFSSKFIHFHLPKLAFIIDSFSFNHAKKKRDRSKKSDYIYIDIDGTEILSIENVLIKYDLDVQLELGNIVENEKQYIDHVSRSYFIMCKLKEKYHNDITPRMLDNFVMGVNFNNDNSVEIE